jgi:diaminopimelate epimerase
VDVKAVVEPFRASRPSDHVLESAKVTIRMPVSARRAILRRYLSGSGARSVQFSKWHALGNSYVVVEQPDAGPLFPVRVQRLCSVEIGIGSDGVLEVTWREGTHAVVTIWNPDGSTAEMSGNGVRIAARWLARETRATEVTVETGARSVAARMLDLLDVEMDVGEVSVGEPEVVDGIEVTAVSVGNPHAVIRLDDPTREDLLRLGPLLETHPRFPERTNVQLVRVDGRHALTVLVWERGVGETTASGSSSVAAAAVAVARGWCDSPVTVHLPGGDLVVRLEGERACLIGPAELVASGTTPL